MLSYLIATTPQHYDVCSDGVHFLRLESNIIPDVRNQDMCVDDVGFFNFKDPIPSDCWICRAFAENAGLTGVAYRLVQAVVDDTDGLVFLVKKMGLSDFIHKFTVD